jgi:sulfur-oxidizing protein SoxZ
LVAVAVEEMGESMSTRPIPRVRVTPTAKAGEIVEVKTLISHEMENGRRRDSTSNVVPRRIINHFTATFNDRLVFEAHWSPSISANPYQSFFIKLRESGELKIIWTDDDGSKYMWASQITVS